MRFRGVAATRGAAAPWTLAFTIFMSAAATWLVNMVKRFWNEDVIMLELFYSFMTLVSAGIVAYLTYLISKVSWCEGNGLLMDWSWVLARTPALDAFLMFVAEGFCILAAVVCSFNFISNHAVISLDIIYLLSLLLLILYHNLKEAGNSSMKEA